MGPPKSKVYARKAAATVVAELKEGIEHPPPPPMNALKYQIPKERILSECLPFSIVWPCQPGSDKGSKLVGGGAV